MNDSSKEARRQKWKAAVEAWQASGLSISKWCTEQNISHSTFQYWRERVLFSDTAHRSHFKELPQGKNSRIEMECAGVKIYVDNDFDEQILVRCLQILRRVSC